MKSPGRVPAAAWALAEIEIVEAQFFLGVWTCPLVVADTADVGLPLLLSLPLSWPRSASNFRRRRIPFFGLVDLSLDILPPEVARKTSACRRRGASFCRYLACDFPFRVGQPCQPRHSPRPRGWSRPDPPRPHHWTEVQTL